MPRACRTSPFVAVRTRALPQYPGLLLVTDAVIVIPQFRHVFPVKFQKGEVQENATVIVVLLQVPLRRDSCRGN